MWNLKKNDTNEIIYKTNRPTDKKKKKNRLWLPKEKGGWKDKLRLWD